MTLNNVKLEGADTLMEYLANVVSLVFPPKSLMKPRLGYQIH